MIKITEKTKKRITYSLRIILIVFISLVCGLTVYTWNNKTLKGDVLPMPFKFGVAVVLTGSMEPNLSEDDLIIIKKTNDYNVEDIVVFQDKYTLVVHRIISVDGDTVITKGDANDSEDAPIKMSQIKGEVIDSYSGVGAVVKAIKSPIGVILLIAGAVILLRLSYKKETESDNKNLKDIKEEIRKLKEEIYKK